MSGHKCIGEFYWIEVPEWHEFAVANCIDAGPHGKPKRMRVQNGCHQGDVVMPNRYRILARDNDLKEIFKRVHS